MNRRLLPLVACLSLAAVALVPGAADAQAGRQNGVSLGLELGAPSGVTLRAGIGQRAAIQVAFGYDFVPGGALVLMGDFTWDAWDFLRGNPTASLLFYFGGGPKLEWFASHYYGWGRDKRRYYADLDHVGVGARALVGLRAAFRTAPFDVFFEIAPLGFVVVVPDPWVFYDFDVSLGFRYRF